jgi:CheY-like chemotaxis protein
MMPTIGIVDDRRTLRRTLVRKLSTVLPTGWDSADADPLIELSDYPSWLTENDVTALILDERLHEQAEDVESQVTYSGHDLVDYLRQRFTTLPIFVVTSYPEDESLKRRFKDVEAIIGRADFVRDADKWAPRITRASQKYFETVQAQLSELADVSLKIATGEATKDDQDRAKAIQSNLQAPFVVEQIGSKSDWLNQLEGKLSELDALKGEIDEYLSNLKDNEMDQNT